MDVITYQCWHFSHTILVKGVPGWKRFVPFVCKKNTFRWIMCTLIIFVSSDKNASSPIYLKRLHAGTTLIVTENWILKLNKGKNFCITSCRYKARFSPSYFADDIIKCIFLNENVWISLTISLKFIPRVRIDNIPALVQIMYFVPTK